MCLRTSETLGSLTERLRDQKKRRRSFHLAGALTQELVSRVLALREVAHAKLAIIPLGRASPRASCGLPWGSGGQPSDAPLRGLAPDGVCLAALGAPIRRSSVAGRRAISWSELPPARRLPPDPCSRSPVPSNATYFALA